MRMTPKISDRPLPTRNSNAPYETPLNAWISQKFRFIPPSPSSVEKVGAELT